MKRFWQVVRRAHLVVIVAGVFGAGYVLGSGLNVSSAQFGLSREDEEAFAPLYEAFQLVQDYSLNEAETDVLVEGAITGMLEALDDPFTGYIPVDVYPLLNEDLSGEIEGIGAVVATDEETEEVYITNVLRGTPAEAAGILPGDVIFAVDGEPAAGLTQLELVGLIRGPRGSEVEVTVLRGDLEEDEEREEITFTLTRERIEVPVVEYTRLEGDIGLIRLYEFNPLARPQLEAALEELDPSTLEGVILDMRGNPGGTLSSAIEIGSAFIEEGTLLTEEFADGSERVFEASGEYLEDVEGIPMVVLVDEFSASAAELIAGALQDTERATIVGETTFGKGTVQIWQPLSNGGGVRITNGRWLTPDGNWIHEQGITPDVESDWDPEEVVIFDITDEDALADDPQLQTAVDLFAEGEVLAGE